MPRRLLSAAVLLLSLVLLARTQAQPAIPTSTPVQINLSTLAQPAQDSASGPTPTRTPTQPGVALLEAKDFANVRAQPSTDAAQLGQIRAGTKYNVLGRYVSWIEFQFQASPTGTGWVFGDLVNLTGNVDNIPNIDPYAQASVDSGVSNATATQAILTQTPGGVLTATVLARIAAPPGAATDSGTQEILPTFTYPPGIVPIAPTPGAAQSTPAPNSQPASSSNSADVPPIVLILALGGVGLLGLALSSLRRS